MNRHRTPRTLAYLKAILGPADNNTLVEIRFRRRDGMGQRFFARAGLPRAARLIRELGATTDVYVGVAPRNGPCGRRAAIKHVSALWVDCDSREAVGRLRLFDPAPSIVIRSGSQHGRHAYWLLDSPMPPDAIEDANRRLAAALRGDARSTDAARVLRPPGTRNFKYDPPAEVRAERWVLRRTSLQDVVGDLPELTLPAVGAGAGGVRDRRTDDALLNIEPEVFVQALLGVRVGRSRKVSCPFHDDSTPSLHVYDTPAGGWYCFGCGRGTSVYDLAAPLWGLQTRGADFLELRRRLRELLLGAAR